MISDKSKIVAAFIASILIMLVIGVYSYISIKNYKDATAKVSHTQSVMAKTQELLSYLQDIETAIRGFAISGEEEYLVPYHHAIVKTSHTYNELRVLTSDNPSQQRLLDTLSPIIALKKKFSQNVVHVRRTVGFNEAQELILNDVGALAMGKSRLLLRQMTDEENSLLTVRLQRSRDIFVSVILTVITSILISVGLSVIALYFFVRDHNKRLKSEQEVKESELRLIGFLDALPIGIFILDANGNPFYANQKSTEILGKGIIQNIPEAEMSKIYNSYIAGTDNLYPPDQLPVIRALHGEKNVTADDLEIKRGGARIPLRINASQVYDSQGNIIYSISAFEDVTEVKRAAKELLAAKQVAEDALILKDTFLANMSHEIRTPMNAIIGFTDILSRRNLGEQEKGFVETIKRSGENLLRIINDILDFSKIEAKMMVFEDHPLSVRELLKSLHTMFMSKAEEKNLFLKFTVDNVMPEVLLGDPTRLTQILINLVNNALKFTSKGGVTVMASLLSEEEEHCVVEFVVKDTGIGIPEDKLQNIFERFRQAESHIARNYGGTGLGLSIAKQLIELQGGNISIESKVSHGSAFTFVLPLKKLKADSLVLESKDVEEIDRDLLSEMDILLVEDNPINVKLVMSLFDEYKIVADVAENGQEALARIREKQYHVILMDMEMPILNGYETTQVIRREMGNLTPIVAMTAHAMAGEKEKCLQMGMNDYISKPINEILLFEKIYKHGMTMKAADENAPKPEKITDLSMLIELMRGKKNVISETLEMFLKQVEDDLPVLDAAVEKEDFVTIKGYAHRLKSSVAMLGIHSLEQILNEMEALGKVSLNIEKVKQLNKRLKTLFDQAVNEVKDQLAEYK